MLRAGQIVRGFDGARWRCSTRLQGDRLDRAPGLCLADRERPTIALTLEGGASANLTARLRAVDWHRQTPISRAGFDHEQGEVVGPYGLCARSEIGNCRVWSDREGIHNRRFSNAALRKARNGRERSAIKAARSDDRRRMAPATELVGRCEAFGFRAGLIHRHGDRSVENAYAEAARIVLYATGHPGGEGADRDVVKAHAIRKRSMFTGSAPGPVGRRIGELGVPPHQACRGSWRGGSLGRASCAAFAREIAENGNNSRKIGASGYRAWELITRSLGCLAIKRQRQRG